jgi:hypothetical protein
VEEEDQEARDAEGWSGLRKKISSFPIASLLG